MTINLYKEINIRVVPSGRLFFVKFRPISWKCQEKDVILWVKGKKVNLFMERTNTYKVPQAILNDSIKSLQECFECLTKLAEIKYFVHPYCPCDLEQEDWDAVLRIHGSFNNKLCNSLSKFCCDTIGYLPDSFTKTAFNLAYRFAIEALSAPDLFNLEQRIEKLSFKENMVFGLEPTEEIPFEHYIDGSPVEEKKRVMTEHEVAAIFCMTCTILSQETTPTAEIEILMDKIGRKYANEIKYFLPPTRKQGNDKGTLFDSVEETKIRASEFLDLFHGTDLPLVNNSQQNIINKTIKIKCKEWFGKRTPINASAVYRFLYNDCKLKFKSEEKTWRTFFRKFYTD